MKFIITVDYKNDCDGKIAVHTHLTRACTDYGNSLTREHRRLVSETVFDAFAEALGDPDAAERNRSRDAQITSFDAPHPPTS